LYVKASATILAGLSLLLLASCATTYQPLGWSGGYEDYRATGDQYEVYFRSNGYASPNTVYQFFLMRAAEIAMKNRYSSFYVLQAEDWAGTATVVTPGRAYETGYVNVYRTYSRSRYGNIGYIETTVTTGPVVVYTPPRVYKIRLPGFHGRIQLVNERLEGQPQPFDAQSVYDDGLALKDQVDSYNRQVAIVGGVAVAAVVVGSLLFH
jgi:hypothetical protein